MNERNDVNNFKDNIDMFHSETTEVKTLAMEILTKASEWLWWKEDL